MRRTHNRSQRFGGHTKHAHYCVCGRIVHGNGGRRHFELEGHHRVTFGRYAELFPRRDSATGTESWEVVNSGVEEWVGDDAGPKGDGDVDG